MPRSIRLQWYDLPDMTIASTGTESNVVAAAGLFDVAEAFEFYAPATLTGTVTLQVSADGGATYVTLQQDGADVSLPAGKATFVWYAGWTHMKLLSGAAEAAARTFKVLGADGV